MLYFLSAVLGVIFTFPCYVYCDAQTNKANPVLILTHLWLMFGSFLDNNGVHGTENELCQALDKQTTVG